MLRNKVRVRNTGLPGRDLRRASHTSAASGNARNDIDERAAEGVVEVVEIVKATVEFPLPAATCAGVKEQLLSAGILPQEKLTSVGKVVVFGATVMLKLAACPAGVDPLSGETPIVKSKLWAGSTVRPKGAE